MREYMKFGIVILALLVVWGGLAIETQAQASFEGDFYLRGYNDRFYAARDSRGTENYMRYLGRLRTKVQADAKVNIFCELTTWTENNPVSPARNIAGTGRMNFGVSQLFAEMVQPNLLMFDVVRVRAGRQQFPIGDGLSQGESYYFFDKFDAIRFDLAYKAYAFSLFGAITGQNLSASGLYPDPGSDQLYIARLSRPVLGHQVMTYYIYNKLRGQFNDSYIFGGGINGEKMGKRLTYSAEFAYQNFNQLKGLPDKGGLGYMGGIGYRFAYGPFRWIKVETRFAAYQGDDASTEKTERFSPMYPSFYWGSRRGYVSGVQGGDYPNNDSNLEGSRLWYSRVYFVPSRFPKARLQFQYLVSNEWVNNDNYNSMDDEFAIKLYYQVTPQTQLQFRFTRVIPNEGDADVNHSGTITWSEDRISLNSFMAEMAVEF
jgi:hypothetical protein